MFGKAKKKPAAKGAKGPKGTSEDASDATRQTHLVDFQFGHNIWVYDFKNDKKGQKKKDSNKENSDPAPAAAKPKKKRKALMDVKEVEQRRNEFEQVIWYQDITEMRRLLASGAIDIDNTVQGIGARRIPYQPRKVKKKGAIQPHVRELYSGSYLHLAVLFDAKETGVAVRFLLENGVNPKILGSWNQFKPMTDADPDLTMTGTWTASRTTALRGDSSSSSGDAGKAGKPGRPAERTGTAYELARACNRPTLAKLIAKLTGMKEADTKTRATFGIGKKDSNSSSNDETCNTSTATVTPPRKAKKDLDTTMTTSPTNTPDKPRAPVRNVFQIKRGPAVSDSSSSSYSS